MKSKILLVAVFILSTMTAATAQSPYRPFSPNRQVYSTPDPSTQRYSPVYAPVYRPDLPLEQQQYYDRNAVGQNVG